VGVGVGGNRSPAKVNEEKPARIGRSSGTTSPLGGFAVTEVGRPCGSPGPTGGSVTRACARSRAPRSRPYSILYSTTARAFFFLPRRLLARRVPSVARYTRGRIRDPRAFAPLPQPEVRRDNARDATATLPASLIYRDQT